MTQLKGLARPATSSLSDTQLSYHDREIQLRDQTCLLPHHPILAGPMRGWPECLQPVPRANLLQPQCGKYLAPRQAYAHIPDCPQFELFLVKKIVSLVIRKERMSFYGVPVGYPISHAVFLPWGRCRRSKKGASYSAQLTWPSSYTSSLLGSSPSSGAL